MNRCSEGALASNSLWISSSCRLCRSPRSFVIFIENPLGVTPSSGLPLNDSGLYLDFDGPFLSHLGG